jgi:DNA polymerase III alpha subunit (gram-positive type)
MDWVKLFMPTAKTKVTLVAHNGKRYDARILVFENARHNIDFVENIFNVDTLQIFKELFPRQQNYKLGTVYKNQFHEPIPDQHTALADARAMQRLLGAAAPSVCCEKIIRLRESFDAITKRCMKGR